MKSLIVMRNISSESRQCRNEDSGHGSPIPVAVNYEVAKHGIGEITPNMFMNSVFSAECHGDLSIG